MAQPWAKRFVKISSHSTWKRKPIWLPMAKTKMFKIAPRPVVIQEETEEMKKLFNNYRTAVNSLRRYFIKVGVEKNVELDEEVVEKLKADDFLSCSTINDEWNKKISIERDERLARERELKTEKILNAMEKHKKRKEMSLELAKEEVKKVKEIIPTVITSSNIDEEIEALLKNVVDHNYIIDVNGVKYTGNEYHEKEKKESEESNLRKTKSI